MSSAYLEQFFAPVFLCFSQICDSISRLLLTLTFSRVHVNVIALQQSCDLTNLVIRKSGAFNVRKQPFNIFQFYDEFKTVLICTLYC